MIQWAYHEESLMLLQVTWRRFPRRLLKRYFTRCCALAVIGALSVMLHKHASVLSTVRLTLAVLAPAAIMCMMWAPWSRGFILVCQETHAGVLTAVWIFSDIPTDQLRMFFFFFFQKQNKWMSLTSFLFLIDMIIYWRWYWPTDKLC